MPGFPAGWTYSSDTGPGAAASIVVPAAAGIVNVLDSITAGLAAYGAVAPFGPFVQVIINAVVIIQWNLVVVGSAGAHDSDSWNPTGLEIATPPGVAITVQFSQIAPANAQQNLLIQGHCI